MQLVNLTSPTPCKILRCKESALFGYRAILDKLGEEKQIGLNHLLENTESRYNDGIVGRKIMSDTLPLPENRRAVPWHWIVLGLLVVVHAGLLISIGWHENTSNRSLFYLMLGLNFSQPALFAIWAALAPQRSFHRFPWSLLLCALVAFAGELGVLFHGSLNLGFFMIGDLTIFIAATPILLLLRRFTSWQMVQPNGITLTGEYQANQCGVKHLLILTTIMAFTFGLLRTLHEINPNLSLPSVDGYVSTMSIVLTVLFPVIILPWFTLAYRGRIVALIFSAIVIGGLCDLTAYFIASATIPSPAVDEYEEIIKPFFLIQLGAALSVLFTTLVMRFCGFRMIRMPKSVGSVGEA